MTNLSKHMLVKFSALVVVSLMLTLIFFVTSASAELRQANPKLIKKGGILYPNTGDSTQVRYKLPKKAREVLKPGDLIGVLPSNCNSASGPEGEYYICHHGIFLQPYFYGDRLAYLVLKIE